MYKGKEIKITEEKEAVDRIIEEREKKWRKRSSQRGLPDRIWNKKVIQDYVEEMDGILNGYLGHEYRTDNRDRVIVARLKEAGYSNNDIAKMLTSSPARILMDCCDLHMDDEKCAEKLIVEVMRSPYA